MSGQPIGPCLRAALMSLYVRGECRDWQDFAIVGRYNAMRHMQRRGWIEDANAAARAADPDCTWKTHPPRWRLTEAGRKAAESVDPARDQGLAR